MKITMQLSKSTKNTHVYADDSEDAPVPTLYVKKSAMGNVPPESITVEITEDA